MDELERDSLTLLISRNVWGRDQIFFQHKPSTDLFDFSVTYGTYTISAWNKVQTFLLFLQEVGGNNFLQGCQQGQVQVSQQKVERCDP